ncbi:hypothetical protein QOT17_005021 [Balamuthia mandrillaris]
MKMTGPAKAFLVSLLLSTFTLVLAKTGYFEAGSSGAICTEMQPCPNPFAPGMEEFDEYVLAAGEYNMIQFVNITKSVTYRGWLEKGGERPVILGSYDGSGDGGGLLACFGLQHALTETFHLTFSHLVVECPAIAFLVRLENSVPINVLVHDLLIRNANAAFTLVHELAVGENSKLDMKNVEIRDNTCSGPNYKEPLTVREVDWTFENVSLLGNCDGMDKVMVRAFDSSVFASGSGLLFQGNHGGNQPMLHLTGTTDFTMEGAGLIFQNNTAASLVQLEVSSSLRTNGRVSFQHNEVAQELIRFPTSGGSQTFQSVFPIHLQGNVQSGVVSSADDAASVVCFTPCEGTSCDCNDLPVLSWNISSPSLLLPSSASALALPLLLHLPVLQDSLRLNLSLELSAGLVYGQHFLTEPPPSDSDPSSSSLLLVVVELHQNDTRAEVSITRLPALQAGATITIRPVLSDPFTASFFLDMDSFIQVSLQPVPPPPPTFQPAESTVSVSFPTENAPDHTLSLLDPQNNNQPLLNRSVSAQFATLKEVDEEGRVVALASLQEREFVVEELGNTTFNLNHALPFISFSTNISSLLTAAGEGGGGEGSMEQRNLTESIAMKVEFTMFAEEQVMSFAGVEQVMAANTLKWSLLLSSWPFQHRTHSLQLHLSLSSQDGVISLRSQGQSQENAVWMLKLGTENTEIPLNVLPLAVLLLDDPEEEAAVVKVGVEWEEEEEKLVITLPWFAQGSSLLLDPDMSVLLPGEEEEQKEEDEDEDDDGLWWKITIPVVLFVVVVVAVGALVVALAVQKKRGRKTISRRTTVNF